MYHCVWLLVFFLFFFTFWFVIWRYYLMLGQIWLAGQQLIITIIGCETLYWKNPSTVWPGFIQLLLYFKPEYNDEYQVVAVDFVILRRRKNCSWCWNDVILKHVQKLGEILNCVFQKMLWYYCCLILFFVYVTIKPRRHINTQSTGFKKKCIKSA